MTGTHAPQEAFILESALELRPTHTGAPLRRQFAARTVLVSWFALILVSEPSVAKAMDFGFTLEPGVAIPLNDPQGQIYRVGGSEAVKALFGLTPYLSIGPTVSFTLLPAAAADAESGIAWGFGGGLRLKRPHDETTWAGISPWIDADVLYIRTGPLNRPGLDLAAGISVPIGEARVFWLGPFLRFMQVIPAGSSDTDNRDARILTVGLSLEVGTGTAVARQPEEVRIVEKEVIVTKEVVKEVCPDRDQDGVPDSIDRCPDAAGPMENFGCPNYKKVVIKKDKIDLKEKLYFAWDQATLEKASFPVLDEVVQVLNDNKGFMVEVEGHTDSSGGDDHNLSLSEKRARTVLDYLVAHGVPASRLGSKGFGSSVPLDNNHTAAGRENNRRVEFVVHFNIVNTGSTK